MKLRSITPLFAALFLFSVNHIHAQENAPDQTVRPRVVAPGATQGATQAAVNPTLPTPAAAEAPKTASAPLTYLPPSMIQSRISEARRMLKTRPMATALSVPSIQFVTIAALERETSKTHLITLSKQSFLTKGAQVNVISSLGANVTVNVLRANGVNTAL